MHKSFTNEEIVLFHNPECSKAKKAMAYAMGIARSVRHFEFNKSTRTPTQWKEWLQMLGKKPKDLLDKSKPYYQENLKGRDFVDEDWLNIVIRNPWLIRSPIAIRGKKVMFLDNPTDILKLL